MYDTEWCCHLNTLYAFNVCYMHITLLRFKKAPYKCKIKFLLDIRDCISLLTSTIIIFSKAHDMQCSHTPNVRLIEHLPHTFSLGCLRILVTQSDNNNPSNIEKKLSPVHPKPLKKKKKRTRSRWRLWRSHSKPRIYLRENQSKETCLKIASSGTFSSNTSS